jgi:quinol monooxygenase YgiN
VAAGLVTVTATFVLAQAARTRFVGAASAVIPPTHAEEGCLTYRLHEDAERPSVFMFYEEWSSAEALEAHLASAYVASFLEAVEPLLEAPIAVHTWRAADF